LIIRLRTATQRRMQSTIPQLALRVPLESTLLETGIQ
jgi:hypothetical protein